MKQGCRNLYYCTGVELPVYYYTEYKPRYCTVRHTICTVPHRDVKGVNILVQAGRRGGGNGEIGTEKEFLRMMSPS